ncbi:hypothetical protein B0J11DRAFT_240690 [Dendryphion nanum]|uniref:PD-(D/E)XK nuclease-like domain-containing protein n=1 Tax=Dendryphion nanum TaxID=256645 RepID=A0A9P9CXG5_9PLEO|nr:hypothetical protein B0J11DRAFT_240690 [Dendryphion nanum]
MLPRANPLCRIRYPSPQLLARLHPSREGNLQELDRQCEFSPTRCRGAIQLDQARPEANTHHTTRGSPARDLTRTPGADAFYSMLAEIQTYAQVAMDKHYPESSWNSFVHTPTLLTVFSQVPPSNMRPQARVVGAMVAGIVKDCLPEYDLPPSLTSRLNTTKFSASSATTQSSATGTVVTSTIDTKRVDYVLSLALPVESTLGKVVSGVSWDQVRGDSNPWAHVNQTSLLSLQLSPIAVSIETKVASGQDPLLQLGTWTAAWYKRMRVHRAYLYESLPKVLSDGTHEDKMPTTLVLEVVKHE